jgi:hypothetical protein
MSFSYMSSYLDHMDTFAVNMCPHVTLCLMCNVIFQLPCPVFCCSSLKSHVTSKQEYHKDRWIPVSLLVIKYLYIVNYCCIFIFMSFNRISFFIVLTHSTDQINVTWGFKFTFFLLFIFIFVTYLGCHIQYLKEFHIC